METLKHINEWTAQIMMLLFMPAVIGWLTYGMVELTRLVLRDWRKADDRSPAKADGKAAKASNP